MLSLETEAAPGAAKVQTRKRNVIKLYRLNEKRTTNQQCTHNKLPTDLHCKNFVNNHRVNIQIGAECAEMCVQRVCIPTELPFCIPPLVVGHNDIKDFFLAFLEKAALSGRVFFPRPTALCHDR